MHSEASKTVNNRDSLRTQLVDSMADRFGRSMAESVFQCELWPVLEAAMKAGELLVHRATVPQVQVSESIISWLTLTISKIEHVLLVESTVSRAQVIGMLKQLAVSGGEALKDAKSVNESAEDLLTRQRRLTQGSPKTTAR